MEKKDLLPLQVECTMLFQSDPSMQASPEGLAARFNRSQEDVQHIIEVLLAQGIVQQLGDVSSPVYRYNEPSIIDVINPSKERDSL